MGAVISALAMPTYPDCIPAQCQGCAHVYGFAPRCGAEVLVCAMWPGGPDSPGECPDFEARGEGAPVEGHWAAVQMGLVQQFLSREPHREP
jgi:hypothetical protein